MRRLRASLARCSHFLGNIEKADTVLLFQFPLQIQIITTQRNESCTANMYL